MTAPPILTQWDGEHFTPIRAHARIADKHYVVGERYALVQHEDRNMASHRHYFAAIREAWMNLGDVYDGRFQSPEALRKFLLIKAGFCDRHTLVCGSHAEAVRVAAFIRPVDEFAIVEVEGRTVTRYVAQSQAVSAMGAKRFHESKRATLDLASDMVGVTPRELEEAGRAA